MNKDLQIPLGCTGVLPATSPLVLLALGWLVSRHLPVIADLVPLRAVMEDLLRRLIHSLEE